MASTSKFFLLIALLAMTMPLIASSGRLMNYPRIGSNPRSLASRLNVDEESTNCWDSLLQIHACSGEVMLFFFNGEAYLGHSCCEAIRTIEHQCWPALLGTLGFTSKGLYIWGETVIGNALPSPTFTFTFTSGKHHNASVKLTRDRGKKKDGGRRRRTTSPTASGELRSTIHVSRHHTRSYGRGRLRRLTTPSESDRALQVVERDSLAIAGSFTSLFSSLRSAISEVTGNSVDHMRCFSDAAGGLQESVLDAATKGNRYMNSCLRLNEEMKGVDNLALQLKILRRNVDALDSRVNRLLRLP
ncbi:uncharacterized protein LOC126795419 [Argentina anserina]|uniref:uncharacterized protein LOC126795419 n=1 Tax=Argentina anserina TaxID=57926 RepID=UPI0021765902|nr:uncharacterized protein LOC126795419 [Potentilla anserina]